jgi:hypothetical protein
VRRNKFALFFTVSLVLCILLSACTIEINVSPKDTKPDEPRTPVEQVQPTTVPPTPTDVPPIPTEIPPTAIPPTPTEIPPSPTPMPVVTLGVVDMGDGFWLTYDTALWRINSDRGYNFLQSKTTTVVISSINLGMAWTRTRLKLICRRKRLAEKK